jgi:transposase
MPKVVKLNERTTIKHLRGLGWSFRRIARELKLDRRTVKKHWKKANKGIGFDSGDSWTVDFKCTSISNTGSECKVGRKSSCEDFGDIIKKKLAHDLSGQRIFQDLRADHGYQGSAQSVRRYIRRERKISKLPNRVMHAYPGEEMQVDFGSGAPVIVNGRKKKPHLFRIILSHSRKAYSEVVWHQDTETFIRALENAFRYFCGVAEKIVTDNLKAAVIKADWYDPEINPKLRSFARHYGTVIMPTKPYHPEHKGKIENSIKYCQDNALKKRTFNSLAEQNEFLKKWERRVADTRIHGTTQMQVQKAFETSEKKYLKALPHNLFPCFEEVRRKVQRNGHIEVKRSFYSVPPEHLGRMVWVRFDNRTVRIFNDKFEQISVHCRMAKGAYSTLKNHIPREKINPGEYGSGYLLRQLYKIGSECAVWGEVMLNNRGIEGIRVLQGLLSLKKKYSSDELNRAALEAVKNNIFYLKDFKKLINCEKQQQLLSFKECHPYIRKLSSYQQLTPNVFDVEDEVYIR